MAVIINLSHSHTSITMKMFGFCFVYCFLLFIYSPLVYLFICFIYFSKDPLSIFQCLERYFISSVFISSLTDYIYFSSLVSHLLTIVSRYRIFVQSNSTALLLLYSCSNLHIVYCISLPHYNIFLLCTSSSAKCRNFGDCM